MIPKSSQWSKWLTGTPHVWILGAEKLSLQSFNLKPFMEIALSAATRHVDGASFLKYAWTAQPDMLVNQIQGRRCRNNDFMPGACVLFPLFNPTHIVLISTLHETFVLFTVLCFKWMRFIWFADVMKYGILILTVLKSYGNTLHRVFATARHYLVPYE